MDNLNSQQYSGLKTVLSVFSKFIIIYETKIKGMRRCSDFEMLFPNAFDIFAYKMRHSLKYATCDEILEIHEYAKYTLFFTKQSVQVVDFCRHLRNSFVHAIMELDKSKLIINDKGRFGKKTSVGYLDKVLVVKFLTEIIDEYENIKM